MFHFLQILDLILFFPILILGFMAGLSGGGNIPAFQRIGSLMIGLAPVTLVCVIASEILWRLPLIQMAYSVVLAPIIIWGILIIWLQVATGFFFKR